MSRHKSSFNCSSSVATSLLCRDTMSSSSSIPCCLTWSFFNAHLIFFSIKLHLRLEHCSCNLNMHFDCCQGFTTSNPLILLRLFCCNLLQPVISVMLIHLLLFFLQKFFFFLNSLLHNSLVSYSIFLHINQSFEIKINKENVLKMDDF